MISSLDTPEMTLSAPALLQGRGPAGLCDLDLTSCDEKWLMGEVVARGCAGPSYWGGAEGQSA